MGLIAAGVAFYAFLALIPLLGAVVLVYGLVVEPATVLRDMNHLAAILPADAAKLVSDQLLNAVKASDGKKGFGLAIALALSIFAARNGAGSVIIALNVAYEVKETRGFVRLTVLAMMMTMLAAIGSILAAVAIAVLGRIAEFLPNAPGFAIILGKIVFYLFVASAGAAGAATLYRFAPDQPDAKWLWITPGSILAAAGWLILTIGFGTYVVEFGKYNAIYGSLGAVVVMLTWLYLSSYVLLVGAELNSELAKERCETGRA